VSTIGIDGVASHGKALMTVQLEDIAVEPGGHAVQFYDRDSELVETAGRRYLVPGLAGGGAAIVVATEAHRHMFDAELRAGGLDPVGARRDGTLVMLDAAETLARFASEGRIDRDGFDRVIGGAVRSAAESGRPVHGYGEMVAVLWGAGDVLGAVELEKLWNELRQSVRFSLLCGYHRDAVAGQQHAEALHEVCHLHRGVVRTPAAGGRPVELCERFSGRADAPRSARRWITAALRTWGQHPDLLDEAELVVSELATNAIVHARSAFSVSVRSEGGRVRLSVSDTSPVAPFVRDPGPSAMFGRGMRLIGDVASDWGVDVAAGGKTVWVELRA
jgi:anti-sigma regulatory factor (Ser/Thr protein kinase)